VAVRKLEDELGVTLFERAPGEITVTPVGGASSNRRSGYWKKRPP
jgi:hypothetical protein